MHASARGPRWVELLEANGASEHAVAALASVPVDALDPLRAAIVRHARAHAYLHAGDADADDALARPARCSVTTRPRAA